MTESYKTQARAAADAAEAGELDQAWLLIEGLRQDARDESATACWLTVPLRELSLDRERRLAIAEELLERWLNDEETVVALSHCAEALADLRYLNQAAPQSGFFPTITRRLARFMGEAGKGDAELKVAHGLSTCARIAGRAFDDAAERAYQVILAADPNNPHSHYNWGLFLKIRGRFAESYDANRRAWELQEGDDSTLWNWGIAATAVGDGETAIGLWRRIGCNLELNAQGLPEGVWPHVQVRLAERPLAERTAHEDEPGLEETIWVERLSPCHGRIASALYQDLGVDFGDIVLFDGAPILHRDWGDRSVPVFPHLATLRRGEWRVFEFAARQAEEGQVARLASALPAGATLYVHTEQVRILCNNCWERRDHHARHASKPHPVVTGKLCIRHDEDPLEVVAVLEQQSEAGVYAPKFFEQLGLADHRLADRDRFSLLVHAEAQPEA